MIDHVVATEAPVRTDVVARRIARAHGFQRTGARILDRVAVLAERRHPKEREAGGTFLWPAGESPGACAAFRPPLPGTLRPVDEIALAELAALAREVTADPAVADDPVAAMAQAVGLARVRAPARERLEAAWRLRSGPGVDAVPGDRLQP